MRRCRWRSTWRATPGPSSATARPASTSSCATTTVASACRSTRRTACTARPATSRTRPRTSSGSFPRAAAARTTRGCERPRPPAPRGSDRFLQEQRAADLARLVAGRPVVRVERAQPGLHRLAQLVDGAVALHAQRLCRQRLGVAEHLPPTLADDLVRLQRRGGGTGRCLGVETLERGALPRVGNALRVAVAQARTAHVP